MKLSASKRTWPGRKQVFRETRDGVALRDVLGSADESRDGQPLLRRVMANGRRIVEQCSSLDDIRTYSAEAIGQLPARVRGLAPATPPYRVDVSPRLQAAADKLARRLQDAT